LFVPRVERTFVSSEVVAMSLVAFSIEPSEIEDEAPYLRVTPRRAAVAGPRRAAVRWTVVIVAAGLVAMLVGRAGTVLGGGPASVPGHRLGSASYVVQPGDTLWEIAASLSQGGNVALLVQQLANLNGGGALHVGQRLVLP
jgi:hypothetical protein